MPYTVTMPKLTPTMEEGTIAKWHKKDGDFVEAGDLLMEVATDKATVEYNALDSGWLRKIIVPEGGEAVVNQPIAVFTENKDESIEGYKPEGEAGKEAKPQPAKEGGEGATHPQKEPVEAKQIKEEKPAPKSQQLKQPAFVPAPSPKPQAAKTEARIMASPLAKKLAIEKGLDLSTVKGTGPGNRIMQRDLEKAQPLAKGLPGRREEPKEAAGSFVEEALNPIRKVVAKRLQESKTFIPHFYVHQAINANAMDEIRDQLSNVDYKATINDFVIRACALSLREHPEINSGFNSANNTLIRFKTVDISIAVDTENGLITPIVRHADFKSLGEISSEIRALAKKAKEGKLQPHEFQGGSFTVSNLGMFGITDFQAIINPPQAGILAVSGIRNVPVVKNGEIVPGKLMNVSLSVDHRVIDGVMAAKFIKTLQTYLENPASLLI